MSEEVEVSDVPVYDLEPTEFKFKLRNKDTGVVEDYTMRELLGNEREAYMNSIINKFEMTSNGRSRVKNFTGLQSGLLCRCVYDAEGTLVPEKVLTKWPSRLQSDLYKRAQKMSGMDETAEETAKND